MPVTVKELRLLLSELPDDALILFEDPNFGGVYEVIPELWYFTVSTTARALLIRFPFETPCE